MSTAYTLAQVAAFLDGTGKLDGLRFGDRNPTEPGAFWWRKHLRAALAAKTERAKHSAGPCKCGLHQIPAWADYVSWYWQRHGRNECMVELPNERCWCGLLRSEHIKGHADQVQAAPAVQQGGDAARNAALREAEIVCGRLAALCQWGEGQDLLLRCARAVRALQSKPTAAHPLMDGKSGDGGGNG